MGRKSAVRRAAGTPLSDRGIGSLLGEGKAALISRSGEAPLPRAARAASFTGSDSESGASVRCLRVDRSRGAAPPSENVPAAQVSRHILVWLDSNGAVTLPCGELFSFKNRGCYSGDRVFPKLIHIGSFYLPTYGVLVALGFLAGLSITTRLARRSGLDAEKITNLAVYCALAGLLGAKLLMFLFDWRTFLSDPQQIFSLSTLQAAGVFQGGLALAFATAFFYMRRSGLPWLKTLDVFAPGVALGHAIGRVGCFMAGCCWGTECSLPWAVRFTNPDAAELTGVPLNTPLHPSQLYEMGTEALLFVFLYWRFGKAHAAGKIMGLYLVLSSAARFVIEFTRFHEQGLYWGLSLTQWIAIAVAGAGALLLARSEVVSGKPAPAAA